MIPYDSRGISYDYALAFFTKVSVILNFLETLILILRQ